MSTSGDEGATPRSAKREKGAKEEPGKGARWGVGDRAAASVEAEGAAGAALAGCCPGGRPRANTCHAHIILRARVDVVARRAVLRARALAIAGVPYAVDIAVFLTDVRNKQAVVARIQHPIVIVVLIARVPEAVLWGVGRFSMGREIIIDG